MKRAGLPVSTALVAVSTVAWAQSSDFTIDDIVVYGPSRDARRLLETPNAVSVIDRRQIEIRQPSTYEDLLGDVTGVTIEGGPRGISQEPNIRGFQDEQVVIRMDGARQNFDLAHRGRFFTDPEILRQVEVLRGGQSTLYGSGALGGVIFLETKDPSDLLDEGELWAGRVKAGFNSQGTQFLTAATAAFQSGGFDGLGFFSYRPMGEDLKDGSGDAILNSAIDSMNGLVKLGYEPSDAHRFEVSYQRYDDEGQTPPNANAESTPSTLVDRDLSFQTASAGWQWNPADSNLIDLDALFYYNSADVTEDRPFDQRLDKTNYETFGFEVVNRSDFDIGVPVRVSYGIEGYRDQQEATRDGAPRLQAPDASATYASGFAQADFEVGAGVIVTPGLRFDYFEVDPDGDLPSQSDGEVSPRLAVQWQPTEFSQLWVSASRSFRAPSLTELYNDGVHFSVPGFSLGRRTVFTGNNVFIPTPDLEPERAIQAEIGARTDIHDLIEEDDRLSLSANAYYASVDDFIDQTVEFIDFSTGTFNPRTGNFEVNGSTKSRNVDALLWGFEADVAYDTGFWFGGIGVTIPQGLDRDGGWLGSIPQDRIVVTGGFRPWRDVEIGARATMLNGQDDVPQGTLPVGGATVFDLFALYTPSSGGLEGASFAFGIDNVLDREYRIYPNGLNQTGIAVKASAAMEF